MDKEHDVQAVADLLTGHLAQKRMTRAEVASLSGIPFPTIHRYFRGERDIPFTSLLSMLRAMDVSAGAFAADASDAVLTASLVAEIQNSAPSRCETHTEWPTNIDPSKTWLTRRDGNPVPVFGLTHVSADEYVVKVCSRCGGAMTQRGPIVIGISEDRIEGQ